MQNKVYKNYKNIGKYLIHNHLLSAELYIPNDEQTYIPITNIGLKKPRHPSGSTANLMVEFETFDRNSGELSINQYQSLLTYLHTLHISKGAYYKILQHIDPLTTKNTVNYIQAILAFPCRMIKHAFTMRKHNFIECEFIGENGQAIYLLLSPDTDFTWITRLSSKSVKLTQSNLKDMLYLIQHHLINSLYAIYIKSKHIFTLQIFNSYAVNTTDNILRIYYKTGNIALKLDKANVYLIDTDKHKPAFKVNYPSDHITYYIILAPIFDRELIPTLLQ